MSYCHRRLSSEGNRWSNLPASPTSQGRLLPPWGLGERCGKKTSYPGTTIGLLSVIDFSCSHRWSCNKKSKGDGERLQDLGMTGGGRRSTSSVLLFPSSCREWWGKKQEDPANQYVALWLVSSAEFWVFWSWAGLHKARPAVNRQGTLVSKGEKDLCAGVGRVYCKRF